MENIKKLIQNNNLISQGETIGVGVSGGKDSMALLCYLNEISKELDFEIVAITIDHGIRENGKSDAQFVMDFCNANNIRAYKFKIDSPYIAKQKKISLESAAREGRFGVFETLINKHICSKVALAHHKSDQAETVLMHLLRGSGIGGLKGMSLVRDDIFIRPMLETSEDAIWEYVNTNDIPFVVDETNKENEFSRNYIRNQVLPVILKRWPNAINSIVNFSNLASVDDAYINSHVPTDGFIVNEKEVKIPLSYFVYPNAIVSRMIYKALHSIGVNKDIEAKHIELILNFANQSQNGKKLDLPLKVSVFKEYDYLTLINKKKEEINLYQKFKLGQISVDNFGKIIVKKVNELKDNELCFDAEKIPKNAVWRFRENGDIFEKFGGSSKKLKEYFIDKKVPQRIRSTIPVLASENQILIVAGMEISEKIKITENTKKIYTLIIEK